MATSGRPHRNTTSREPCISRQTKRWPTLGWEPKRLPPITRILAPSPNVIRIYFGSLSASPLCCLATPLFALCAHPTPQHRRNMRAPEIAARPAPENLKLRTSAIYCLAKTSLRLFQLPRDPHQNHCADKGNEDGPDDPSAWPNAKQPKQPATNDATEYP